MNGKARFILDTNAVVSLLNGNHNLAVQLESAEYVGMSVVSYLEFLAFDGLSPTDRESFKRFAARVEIVPLAHDDETLISLALKLRSDHRLKLPDANIGATAIASDALLVTNDGHFAEIPSLSIQGC